jgi:tRNA G18 (ribose-2'-O)-methylase SpoU
MTSNKEIVLILEDIRSTHNVGSIFRSAECFGVKHIYICGYTPYPKLDNDTRLPHISEKLNRQISKTALGAEKIVPFSVFESFDQILIELKNNQYYIIGIEQDSGSLPLSPSNIKNKSALILGNEIKGISEWTKQQCDVILEITQYGQKESLNVASAAAISLYAAQLSSN